MQDGQEVEYDENIHKPNMEFETSVYEKELTTSPEE